MFAWRKQYDEEADALARAATDIECKDESRVQAQFAEDANLNIIVQRFGIPVDSPLPVAPADPRYYGDFSDVPDLRTALERVRDAQERFYALPAAVRARFENSPIVMYEFVSDPANVEEARSLGLLAVKEKPPVAPAAPGGSPPPEGS